MKSLTNIKVQNGQAIEFSNTDNTSTGSIRQDGLALKFTGPSTDVAISAGHNLVFQGATASVRGMNSILTIGGTGDTVGLDNAGATYTIPKITGDVASTGSMTATSYKVGATTVIGTDAKIDYSIIKNTPSSFPPATHTHAGTAVVDNRAIKPNATPKAFLSGYFTSLEGLTGVAGTDYQDLLVLNGYTDGSGGLVNALAFDKSSMSIKHYLAGQADATWGVAKTLAYTADITWTNLGGKPTTIGTFGITDANTKTEIATLLAGKSDTTHGHTFASLTSIPTTLAGYGITDASSSSHVHTFASLTSKPTTLAGYGIADASLSTHTHTFGSLTSIPTTVAGYGISDVYTKLNMQINGQAQMHWNNLTNIPTAFTPAAHTHALTDLSDVTITAPAANHAFHYDGIKWVNTSTPYAKAWLTEGFVTATATAANQWTKVASVSLTASGQVSTARLQLMGGNDTGASGTAPIANIFFRVRQQTAMATAPIIGIRLMENQNITIDDVKAVTSVNTAGSTVVDLYTRIVDLGERFYFVPLIHNGNITFLENQALVLTLPAGTQTASIYDMVDIAQLPSGTTAAKGIVQLNSTTSSTSTTLAATPSAVKAAYDLAALALPKTGGAISSTLSIGGLLTATGGVNVGATNVIDTAGKVSFSNLKDVPASFTPAVHTHDDRYFTETESDLRFLAIGANAVSATTAGKLTTGRTIAISGDVTATGVAFDGTGNITIATTYKNSGVVAGTYTKVTTDIKGNVTAGGSLIATDIPDLDWAKITSGKPTTISGYGLTDAFTKSEVQAEINKIVDAAPGTLDTLNELAAALGDDPNFATTMSNQIATKADIAHTHTLDSLSNVTIATPGVGEVVRWDGAKWVNGAIASGDVPSGSTGGSGVVQLIDSVTSTSTTLAATANSVKTAYDLAASKVASVDVVATATANKILKLDASGYLPANAVSSTKWLTGRTLGLTGDLTGTSAAFDGTGNITFATTLANSGVTAGTYGKVTVDSKGRVTVGAALAATDIPNLDWAKITTGKPTTLLGYGITDAAISTHTHTLNGLSDVSIASPSAGQVIRWNGTSFVNSTIAAADIANASTSVKGVVQLTDSVASTSTLLAPTANAVKIAYDIADAALGRAGGVMTGKITTPNTAMGIRLGDDAEIGDVGIANQFGIQGVQDPTTGGLTFGSGKDTNIYRGGVSLLKTDDSFQAVGAITSGGILTVAAGDIRSDTSFGFLTTGGTAQQGKFGSLLASNAWADASKVPTNGIYSKGAIKTDDNLDVGINLNVVGNATIGGSLDMSNDPINNVTIITGQFGTIARSTDEWLRINEDSTHTGGTYFGSTIVRTDGELQVGSSGSGFRATATGISAPLVTTPSVIATGPGESKFSNGTFADPHAGTTYGAKVSQGVSTDKLNLGGKVNIQYNATENSLDFVFI